YIGAIHIKSQFDSKIYIKFGPIKNYAELAEIIYLNLLKWKAKNGFLENKEQIIEKQKKFQKEQLIPDEKDKLIREGKKGVFFDSDITLITKILISICIILTITIAVPFIVELIYFSTINIGAPFYGAGLLIGIYGMFKKKKYGFILIIIEIAFQVIISIIFLYIVDLIIFGIVLTIAIFELWNYKKNYQESIEPKHIAFCINCGKAVSGNFCNFCGNKLDIPEKIVPLNHDNPILQPILNYLNPDEKVCFIFKPEINTNKNIILILVGIFCLIMFFAILFISFVLFFVLFLPITIGAIWGILNICSLSSKLTMKKSIFIFTNQKIIAKIDKNILMTPYLNIASISSVNRKTQYEIEILLKKPIESSPFMNKFVMYIPHIPKNSDLIERIKHLRRKLTSSNKNLNGDG
ncbi:MAG: hypothetical protein ACFFAN_17950, partial [Promethearchaeota archaeon]